MHPYWLGDDQNYPFAEDLRPYIVGKSQALSRFAKQSNASDIVALSERAACAKPLGIINDRKGCGCVTGFRYVDTDALV